MKGLLIVSGRIAGLGGILLCAISGGLRMSGRFLLGTFSLGTLLLAGMAVILFACFCLLAAMTTTEV